VAPRTLNNEEWSRISPFLDQALELTGGARVRWLAALAADDPALAADLQALLALHAVNSSTAFLEHGPLRGVDDAALVGQPVGAYTLESRLGRGGMGSVWSARRSDGMFEGRVAVKLLERRGLGPRARAQIRREAGVLARLSHPNIARLFDAGVRANGQPFLIIEYIQGEHIDRYCDARRLALPARLRLMLPVLDAVEHAHRQNIVHRDLKPSNILVTGEGAVKLLDFGVASFASVAADSGELTGFGDREASEQTSMGMTLGYASPEQIRGEAICGASDVYALGVLLHLLVTGHHPHRLGAGATPTELARATLEVDLPPASRWVDSPEAQHAVRGGLDAIIGRATLRSVSERYATAAALAADIHRFLDG
jgi:serine/threonine protein kinase